MFIIISQELPTQVTGLAAYATAFTCCCIAWIRTKTDPKMARPGMARLAAGLVLLESAMLLDMAFNLRWKVHQALMDIAQRNHEYAERRLPQTIVIVLLVCLLFFGLFRVWRSFHGRGTTLLAVAGGLLSLIVWCVEVVSLHAVDHYMYHRVGGLMSVTFLWILSCSMTSIGILLDPR